jgi:hypothetical protein
MRRSTAAVAQSAGIAASFFVFGVTLPAEAQQTITLSCDGVSKLMATSAADLKPDPINRLGIIVNLLDRTVTFSDYVIPISGVTSTLISFMAQQAPVVFGLKSKPFTVDGSIDRVTGYTNINWWHEVVGNNTSWELTCRPATRLF